MWLAATVIFSGTAPNFWKSLAIENNFQSSVYSEQASSNNVKLTSPVWNFQTIDAGAIQAINSKEPTAINKPLVTNYSSITKISIKHTNSDVENLNTNYDADKPISFKSGVASWKTDSKIGILGFDGNFNSEANFQEGKALWQNKTVIGSLTYSPE
jgi:hypothetical protein